MPKQAADEQAEMAGQDAAEMPEAVTEQPAWQGEWKVDLSAWSTMGDIMRWQDMAENNSFRPMTQAMRGYIKRWPYSYDPSKAESYEKIKAYQWRKAAEQVGKAANAFFLDPGD